jgi:hypothetical protein
MLHTLLTATTVTFASIAAAAQSSQRLEHGAISITYRDDFSTLISIGRCGGVVRGCLPRALVLFEGTLVCGVRLLPSAFTDLGTPSVVWCPQGARNGMYSHSCTLQRFTQKPRNNS